ncbi:YheC/YheD family endospore coat-associated protein [Dethiobacter alkaliphilus]|uniref:ATP-grasp domain-containing protein n=1 Tax=Dethiobacter alkaliphilus AHT 1 TaxID=555088 RepID=C0GCE0_DETAL|nr:YheC/YheD family protein [Dethiobacter alkaliphilus]EEG78875.1 conserved hypothetical protein [Dethiobacter alkaliphilus AHT 1]
MKIVSQSKLKRTQIMLSPDVFKESDVLPRKVIFHFGQWKKEVNIVLEPTLAPYQIGLSEHLLQEYTLPDCYDYDMQWDGRNLKIGPVIAFLTIHSTEKLEQKLDIFEGYFAAYPHFQGLIYICAIDGIDTKEKKIDGFYYDPTHGAENKWKKGTFPYPGAMYRKTGFSARLYDQIINELGDKLFNTYFFNKWELWAWLSPNEDCEKYLPHTRRVTGFQDIKEMLDLYGEVYLKKVNSHKAKGIIKVVRTGTEYSFIYRLRGTKKYTDPEQIEHFINEINQKKDYLVQQAIPVKTHEERHFDFRVIMQKNRLGKWVCSGNIARFGKKDSIATNFLLAGYALSGNEALKTVFKYNERDAFIKEQEIIQACTLICEKLDLCCGNYGDLGVDVIVDENQKVWVLEVNKLQDHKYPVYALNDEQMYYKVTTTLFEYAAFLAGF